MIRPRLCHQLVVVHMAGMELLVRVEQSFVDLPPVERARLTNAAARRSSRPAGDNECSSSINRSTSAPAVKRWLPARWPGGLAQRGGAVGREPPPASEPARAVEAWRVFARDTSHLGGIAPAWRELRALLGAV
jgi:hypothetical protein